MLWGFLGIGGIGIGFELVLAAAHVGENTKDLTDRSEEHEEENEAGVDRDFLHIECIEKKP